MTARQHQIACRAIDAFALVWWLSITILLIGGGIAAILGAFA